MRIVIATTRVAFVRGGAEVLVGELESVLVQKGHEVEVVAVPWTASVIEQMLACRLVDLTSGVAGSIDLLIGMKFPAYLIPHPKKVLWLMHQYRQAYDLWEHYHGLSNDPRGQQTRDAIIAADRRVVRESSGVFTIAANVSKRLRCYTGADSRPLYPPPRWPDRFRCRPSEDYLFFPSRISLLKRHDLVIEALARTRMPVRVRFAGSADVPAYAEQLKEKVEGLGLSDRVDWLGWVSDSEIVDQYARCRGVVFPPMDEDYGFVTLEAMLSSKPVVTCSDSGGTLEFLVPGETGLVAEPTPEDLAAALDRLWENPGRARRWGEAGRRRYDALGISWEVILEALLR